MDSQFKAYIDQLPVLMEQLRQKELKSRNDLGNIPTKGIYVFYENGNPIYVGRSKGIKERVQQHSRPSSGHNTAPFAFNLAKEAAERKGIDINKNRKQLEKNPHFSNLFGEAKERVSRMSVQIIEVNDPIPQTLFEVYAAVALKTTKYNDFDTH